MTNTERDMPAANRADSEINFVLRRVKWRRGPDVLRDLARAQADDAEARPAQAATRTSPRKR